MSSLTLIEIRIPTYRGEPGTPGAADTVISAEWFKTYPGAKQYRMTWGAAGLWTQRGVRYYASAAEAVSAALSCARRIYKSQG